MKYKETPVQNLTFIALMAGINVIFCLLCKFLPFSTLIFTLLLPFVSTLVMVFCKARYTLIYVIATLLLTLIISPQDALFYILAPMLSGIIFGFCYKHNVNYIWTIVLASISTIIVYYITTPLIELIFGTPVFESFKKILLLSEEQARNYYPSFVLITSIFQTLLSFIIINNDLAKYMKYKANQMVPYNILSILSISTGSISIMLLFFYYPLSLVFMFISWFLSIYPFIKIFKNKKGWLIVLTLILSIFIFAILYPLINKESAICLISIFPIIISIISLFIKNSNQQDSYLFDKYGANE
ncbi:MAG: hypothetical protein ACI311_06375 [Bacilli bacterium]